MYRAQRLTPGMHRERWAAWPGHGMWEQGPDRMAGVEASRLVHRPRRILTRKQSSGAMGVCVMAGA